MKRMACSLSSMKFKLNGIILPLIFAMILFQGCSSNSPESTETNSDSGNMMKDAEEMKDDGKGIGPVKSVEIPATIDAALADNGQKLFEAKCTACHKYDERYVGPALGKVTERRTPEYIMNMILDTETMIENDDTVKCLLQEFMMKMPNQSVDEKDARSVLEHLREHAATAK